MPQPPEATASAQRLIDTWRAAEDSLTEQLREALLDGDRVAQQHRLRQLLQVATEMRTTLEQSTRDWLTVDLPAIHRAGAEAAATALGTAFEWSMPHVDAVQHMAARTWGDVAAHLQRMDADTRRALRAMTRDTARAVLTEGRTAAASGRTLERWMLQERIGAVAYRDGTARSAGDYADMLARTVTAQSYNGGTLTQSRGDGFLWIEVTDGFGCGWTTHDDADKAAGTVRHIDDCEAHSISHPRCARSFAPRPDVEDAGQAEAARLWSPEEQARLAAEENARARTATVTLSGRARAPRSPRQARTPRASTAAASSP